MTLTTVKRYDPTELSTVGDRAIVIGASVAGLCAARVLAEGFESVMVIDADPLPEEPIARRGVPQSRHIHLLQGAGRDTLEDLFPGFGEALLSAGGVAFDPAHDGDLYMEGGFLADGTRRRSVYSATRPLYEHILRQRVSDIDGVSLRPNCRCTDYLVDDASEAVTGVVVQSAADERAELTADLVVDATGRTSKTPQLLDAHGYTAPPVEEVHNDVAYSSTLIERPPGNRDAVAVIPSPDQPRGGVYTPVEDDQWLVTLWSMHGEAPPTEYEEFAAFAADLPTPHLRRLLDTHEPTTTDVAHYPFPSSRRRRYEDVERFPDGLVVLGDAIASFNPIYGQGISVAALEAVVLHRTLAEAGREDVGRRFFDRVADLVDVAWDLAVSSDHRFPQTEGAKPRGTAVRNWYLSRLLRKARTDGKLVDAFLRIQMMEAPPTLLFRPRYVWRVLKPG